MRATRRLDQLRQAQRETVGLNRGAAVPTRVDDKPTLASQGIDKNLAHQARSLTHRSVARERHGRKPAQGGKPETVAARPHRRADAAISRLTKWDPNRGSFFVDGTHWLDGTQRRWL
jgi:hypothetical protein